MNRIDKLPKRIREKWDEFARIVFEAVYGTTNLYDVLIVSFSGGPDSTALLCSCTYLRDNFQRLSKRCDYFVKFPDDFKLKIVAAHLDHSIRPESRNEAKWCADLAKTLDVEFSLKRLEENEIEKKRLKTNMGIESMAREFRREFQIELAKSIYEGGFSAARVPAAARLPILLNGHTANDQAETVLMNLARGSGMKGACGILKRTVIDQFNTDKEMSLVLVRPFLDTPKGDLLSLLELSKICYLTDETNLDEQYTPRNAVRSSVVPALEKLYPATVEHFAKFAQICQSHFESVSKQAADFVENNSVPFCFRFKGLLLLGIGVLENQLLPKKRLRELSSPVRHEVYTKFLATHNVSISFNLMNEIDDLIFSDQSKVIAHNIETSSDYFWIYPEFPPFHSTISSDRIYLQQSDLACMSELKRDVSSFDKVSFPVHFEKVRSQRVKPRSVNKRMNIRSYYRSIGLPESVICSLRILVDAKKRVVWFSDIHGSANE